MAQLPFSFENFDEAYKNNASGQGGFFPVGSNGFYHGGVHLYSKEPVRAVDDGQIVAYRFNRGYIEDKKADKVSYLSNSFVLLKQEHETPKKQKIEYYSLYMHLLPWDCYKESQRSYPQFVYSSSWVIDTDEDGAGQNIRSENDYNTIVGVIPREGVFRLLGESSPQWPVPEGKPEDLYRNYRKVSWSDVVGFTWLSDNVASKLTDTVYQLHKSPKDPPLSGTAGLNVRNGGKDSPVLAVLPKGTQVYFDDEKEFRAGKSAYCKLSSEKHKPEMAGFIYIKNTLKEVRIPQEPTLDVIVNPEHPIEVKKGDILGFAGNYYDENVLHFEIFTRSIDFLKNPKKDKSSRPYYILKGGARLHKRIFPQPQVGLKIEKNAICILLTKQSECGKGFTKKSRCVSVVKSADVWIKRSEIAPGSGGYYCEEDKTYKVAFSIANAYTIVDEEGNPVEETKVNVDIQKGECLQFLDEKRGEFRLVRAKLSDEVRNAYWVNRDKIQGTFKGNEYWIELDLEEVFVSNPELPNFDEAFPKKNDSDKIFESSQVEVFDFAGVIYYGFPMDGSDERGWVTMEGGVKVLDPYNWEQFFDVIKDPTHNGYCDVKELIQKIEEVKGNKKDRLLQTDEIKRAVNDEGWL